MEFHVNLWGSLRFRGFSELGRIRCDLHDESLALCRPGPSRLISEKTKLSAGNLLFLIMLFGDELSF